MVIGWHVLVTNNNFFQRNINLCRHHVIKKSMGRELRTRVETFLAITRRLSNRLSGSYLSLWQVIRSNLLSKNSKIAVWCNIKFDIVKWEYTCKDDNLYTIAFNWWQNLMITLVDKVSNITDTGPPFAICQ